MNTESDDPIARACSIDRRQFLELGLASAAVPQGLHPETPPVCR